MKTTAARLVAHGEPLSVEEVDLAQPGEGEVVVEMAFGSVNPVDRYGALGRVAPDGPLPRTLGQEGSGTLDGRPVVVAGEGLALTRDGVWSRLAVVPRSALTPVPDGVPLEKAAAIGIAGVTAWRTVVELGGVGPDDRVLVLGAGGGVGHVVVSLAARLGARVWGQVGSGAKVGFVKELGAEHVIVGDASAVAAQARELRPTVVLDPLGDGFTGAAVEVLARRGRLVLFGTSADARGEIPLQALYRNGLVVQGYGGLGEPDEVLADRRRVALQALAEGKFDIVVDTVLPLAQVNEAFQLLVGRGVKGKVVLDARS